MSPSDVPVRDRDPYIHIIHVSLDHMSQPPNGVSIGSAVVAQLTRVLSTHRHTDHATCGICSNRPHLCTACRRCGLKIIALSIAILFAVSIIKILLLYYSLFVNKLSDRYCCLSLIRHCACVEDLRIILIFLFENFCMHIGWCFGSHLSYACVLFSRQSV